MLAFFNTKKGNDAIRYAGYGLLAAGGVGLLYWAGTSIFGGKSKKQFEDTAGFTASGIASAIHSAIDGFGTNEDLLFSTLSKVTTKEQWRAVAKAYQVMYNEPLDAAIEGELSGSDMIKYQNFKQGLQ